MVRRLGLGTLVVLALVGSIGSGGVANRSAAAATPYSILGLVSDVIDTTSPQKIDAHNRWAGKKVATETFYANTFDSQTALAMWNRGAIPNWAYYIAGQLDDIAAGVYDSAILTDISNMRAFLSGSDLVYGTGDDRRVYIRLAYEANYHGVTYSPCNPNTRGDGETFKAMWRHVWQLYRNAGIDSTHGAFIFSVTANPQDPQYECSAENLFPGAQYVDWLTLDGYPGLTAPIGSSPTQVFGPMTQRLRALAPGKPVGISEVGVSSRHQSGKLQWLTDYFAWVQANDIRMTMYFNIDKTEVNGLNYAWPVFGGGYTGPPSPPDTTYRYCQSAGCLFFTDYKAYSTYRTGVQQPWVRGSDPGNPRILPDDVFLGQ